MRASKSSRTSSYCRTAATGSPPISVMRARTRSRRWTAAAANRLSSSRCSMVGRQRRVGGEPGEGHVLELGDEAEQLDRVGVLEGCRRRGWPGHRFARWSSSSEDRSPGGARPTGEPRRIDCEGHSVVRSSRSPCSSDPPRAAPAPSGRRSRVDFHDRLPANPRGELRCRPGTIRHPSAPAARGTPPFAVKSPRDHHRRDAGAGLRSGRPIDPGPPAPPAALPLDSSRGPARP